jgi:hypothetical protein
MLDPHRGQSINQQRKQREKHSEKNQQININKVILDVVLLLSGGAEPVKALCLMFT